MAGDGSGGAAWESAETILPRYDGQSLLNLAPSICEALGVSTSGLAAPLDEAVLAPELADGVRAVLLLVVDGLGRWQLDAAVGAGDAPTFAQLYEQAAGGSDTVSLSTITSVFPSSTMPALGTLNTGLSPAAHGLLGWTVYLEEFGEAAELARWGPAAGHFSYLDPELGAHDPARFFGLETVHQRLGRAGVRSIAICPAPHRRSGLSGMIFQGADLPGYYATSGALAIAEQLLADDPGGEPLYLYVYWPSLDTVSHHRGPWGAEHDEEVASLDFSFGRWLNRHGRRGDLLVLITADHGHVPSNPNRVVRLDHDPGLLDRLLSPPTGERRLAFLHASHGGAGDLRAHCEAHLTSVAELVDPHDLFERGLFGPGSVSAAARRRAGDLILMARGDHQFVCPFSDRQPAYPLIGNHGALDPREMLVPLLAIRL